MTAPISVVIPVGPHAANKEWLRECLASVQEQTHTPAQVLIIDDQAHLPVWEVERGTRFALQMPGLNRTVEVWKTPWLSGVAHAFNFGVALARTDLVVMLGSDDRLEPWALEDCARAWEKHGDDLGYYSLDVRYEDTGETQSIACGAAMVTKALWRHTGGFPTQAAIGSSDTMLLSILIGQKGAAGNIRRVDSPKGAPYVYKRHSGSDTSLNYGRFEPAIFTVRDRLTRDWKPAEWTRQAVKV